ncbi:MAG TPA: response regulator [Bacilli bacterium]
MWKVLIVEDEVFVRESIREIIRWEDIGYTVVGEAGTGIEALKLMAEFEPDLVLTDIVMPEMDGLELLKHTRDSGCDCRFIMLTCMGEFDYVRKAMEYGASNYILKLSMSVKTLRETLVKMSRELSLRAIKGTQSTQSSYETLWEGLFLNTDKQAELPLIPKNMSKLYKKVYIISVFHGHAAFQPKLLLDQWRENLEESIIHSYAKMGQTTLFIYTDTSVSGMSSMSSMYPVFSEVNEPENLVRAWRKVMRKLDIYWYEESGYADESGQHCAEDWEALTWAMEKHLIHAFELGDPAACETSVELIWKTMKAKFIPMPIVKATAIRLLTLCYRILNRNVTDVAGLYNCVNHNESRQWFSDHLVKALLNQVRLTENDHPEINKALHYIHENYYKDITVKQMADFVAMGENYLSGLFKKKTGKNMIHYLHEVRIKHAQRYLKESDLTISVIGEKVGFANDNYFIKIFKRLTNLTPNEFRKLSAK